MTDLVQKLKEKFKDAIVDSDAIELLILNSDLEIVWLNGVLEEEFGALDTLRGKTCYEELAGDAEPHEGCAVRKALATGEVQRSLSEDDGGRHVVVAIPLGDDHVGELIVKLPLEE